MALTRLAARDWTADHGRQVHANLRDQLRHAASVEAWEFFRDGERFHQLIARAAEHEEIVLALDRNDEKAAAKAMKVHLRSVFNAVARLRPQHEDYFSDACDQARQPGVRRFS